jgi:hypothetical protein
MWIRASRSETLNTSKVFANADAAETWLAENDPEGVAFEYEVLEWAASAGAPLIVVLLVWQVFSSRLAIGSSA